MLYTYKHLSYVILQPLHDTILMEYKPLSLRCTFQDYRIQNRRSENIEISRKNIGSSYSKNTIPEIKFIGLKIETQHKISFKAALLRLVKLFSLVFVY